MGQAPSSTTEGQVPPSWASGATEDFGDLSKRRIASMAPRAGTKRSLSPAENIALKTGNTDGARTSLVPVCQNCHALTLFSGHGVGIDCNGTCGKPLPPAALRWSCAACDLNLCETCAAESAVGVSVADTAGAAAANGDVVAVRDAAAGMSAGGGVSDDGKLRRLEAALSVLYDSMEPELELNATRSQDAYALGTPDPAGLSLQTMTHVSPASPECEQLETMAGGAEIMPLTANPSHGHPPVAYAQIPGTVPPCAVAPPGDLAVLSYAPTAAPGGDLSAGSILYPGYDGSGYATGGGTYSDDVIVYAGNTYPVAFSDAPYDHGYQRTGAFNPLLPLPADDKEQTR